MPFHFIFIHPLCSLTCTVPFLPYLIFFPLLLSCHIIVYYFLSIPLTPREILCVKYSFLLLELNVIHYLVEKYEYKSKQDMHLAVSTGIQTVCCAEVYLSVLYGFFYP